MITLLVLFIFLLGTFKINDSDFWWHLSTGKYIYETTDIPDSDPFTFTSKGKAWITHEWLFGFLIYIIYSLAGLNLLILLKSSLLTATFLLLFSILLKRTANYSISYCVTFVMAILAHHRFYLRPELTTLFFVVLLLYLITSFKNQTKIAFWILPIVFCLWVNLHSGVLFGLYIICAYTFSEALKIIFKSPSALSIKRFCFLLLTSFFSFLATLINPNTFRSLLYPFLVLSAERKILKHNIEWQPPGFDPNFYFFWGILGFLIFILLITYKRFQLFDLLIVIPFSFLAIRSQRSIGLFALMIAPALSWHLKAIYDFISEKWNSIFTRNTVREGLLSILLFTIVAGFYLKAFMLYDKPFVFGVGVRDGMPVSAANFIEEYNLKGNMYNAHEFGGYIIWRFYPDRKAFIDGRNYLHREIFSTMNITMEDRNIWKEFLSWYDIQFAVLSYPKKLPNRWDKFSSDITGLFPYEDWGLAYWDDWAMIYLNRHNDENRKLLNKLEYKIIRPSEMRLEYLDHFLKGTQLPQLVVKELNRKIREHPGCFRAYNILGMVYSKMGHYERAIEQYQKAISLHPRFAQYHYNLAVCYMKNGQYAEAKNELLQTKRLEKNVAKTSWLLKQLRQYGY